MNDVVLSCVDTAEKVSERKSSELKWLSNQAVGAVGTIFRLKGSIMAISFLDCNGILIPTVAEPWKDAATKDDKQSTTPTRELTSIYRSF